MLFTLANVMTMNVASSFEKGVFLLNHRRRGAVSSIFLILFFEVLDVKSEHLRNPTSFIEMFNSFSSMDARTFNIPRICR